MINNTFTGTWQWALMLLYLNLEILTESRIDWHNFEYSYTTTLLVFAAFSNILLDICAKFDISNSSQSPDIRQNSDEGISNFGISGQSHIKVNCHNSRTSDLIFAKNADISKIKRASALKGIFSETTYVCVLMYQISSF